MAYEYSGLLKTILPPPTVEEYTGMEAVEFGPDELVRWTVCDLEADIEWKQIPASHTRTEESIRLVGRFEDIRRIDTLPAGDPFFWVPLSTLNIQDDRLPIDLARFPVVEVTYRCATENAQLALAWTYHGGQYVLRLPVSRRWRTVAFYVPFDGFPARIKQLILRLFSSSRSSESADIRSVRFRGLLPAETEGLEKMKEGLAEYSPPLSYQVLNDFMPLGVVMNAETARRMAETLGVGASTYWTLALEDVVRHHHNCVMLEDSQKLSAAEWEEILTHFDRFNLRLLPIIDIPAEENAPNQRDFVESHIRPFSSSRAILSWCLDHQPEHHSLSRLLEIRKIVEEADPHHPLAVLTRQPGAYASLAPYFTASGIGRFTSHAPWHIGELVHEHSSLCRGQQFWFMAPTFIHATGAPDWSSCPEMRLMANLALANGARGWFSYAYHNDPFWVSGSCQRSLTGPFLTFSDLWLELDQRMDRLASLAPLFLNATAEELPDKWYVSSIQSGDHTYLPDGTAPISSFRFRGPDYDLYIIINNDIRGMASLNIDIPRDSLQGLEIYDVSDFISERQWLPMDLERHLEMFPGQARAILYATPEVCAFWRNNLAASLMEDDRRLITFDYRLARTYDVNTADVDDFLDHVGGEGGILNDLHYMDKARALLVDLLYDTPAVSNARSQIVEASAAVCACDGALCRIMSRGKLEKARELGQRVIPLAREITHLRLELRQGRGSAIVQHSEDVVRRSVELLAEIRSHA